MGQGVMPGTLQVRRCGEAETVRDEGKYILLIGMDEECRADIGHRQEKLSVLLLQRGKEARICGQVLAVTFDQSFFCRRCLPCLMGSPLLLDFFFRGNETGNHLSYLQFDGAEERIRLIARAMETFVEEEETEAQAVMGSLLSEMLYELGHTCFIHTEILHALGEEPQQQIMRLLLERRGLVQADEVALALHYHENTLRRVLKREAGFGFAEICAMIRVGWACSCLHRGEITAREAMRKCGWQNATQFYRQFERCVGLTPAQYRDLW